MLNRRVASSTTSSSGSATPPILAAAHCRHDLLAVLRAEIAGAPPGGPQHLGHHAELLVVERRRPEPDLMEGARGGVGDFAAPRGERGQRRPPVARMRGPGDEPV